MNRLTMQGHDFSAMQALEVLVLASNKLVALHSSVWGLTGLARLDLGHNNLTDLPSDISSLTALTVSRIGGCGAQAQGAREGHVRVAASRFVGARGGPDGKQLLVLLRRSVPVPVMQPGSVC